MNEAVFISDLHLHPEQPEITARFAHFLNWAATHTTQLYILGDFFHAWAGDDTQNDWSDSIAQMLNELSAKKVQIFYMHGNRDFLLGKRFLDSASVTLISDPTVIELSSQRVLLTHGDRYCTLDVGHQWLRRLTRNRVFETLFLCLPKRARVRIVSQVRALSRDYQTKPQWKMDIVVPKMIQHMKLFNVQKVIHGHIHRMNRNVYEGQYEQYVLSDWEQSPRILCYNVNQGLHFISI